MPHMPFLLDWTFSCGSCDTDSARQFFPMVRSKVFGAAPWWLFFSRESLIQVNFSAAQRRAVQNSGCQGGEAFQPGVGVVLSSEHGWASQGHGFLPSTHPSVSPRAPCVAPPRLAVRWGVKHVGFGVKHIQGWMHTLALASKLFKSRSFNFSSFEKWRYFLVGKVFNTYTYLCTVGFKTHQSSWSSQVHRFSEVIGSCWTVPFFPILFKLFLKQVAVCVSAGERSFDEPCCSSSMYKGSMGLTWILIPSSWAWDSGLTSRQYFRYTEWFTDGCVFQARVLQIFAGASLRDICSFYGIIRSKQPRAWSCHLACCCHMKWACMRGKPGRGRQTPGMRMGALMPLFEPVDWPLVISVICTNKFLFLSQFVGLLSMQP